MIIASIKVALVGLFLSLTSISTNANDHADRKETLVDLLGLMGGKDRFRLQYELNGLKTDQNITKNNVRKLGTHGFLNEIRNDNESLIN